MPLVNFPARRPFTEWLLFEPPELLSNNGQSGRDRYEWPNPPVR
jgi:hypothetical protein